MKTKSITTRQTALITGASSGIGYELAKLFARDDHDLVLVSRMAPMLERIARELKRDCGVHVTIIAKDLFRPEAAQELYDEIRAAGITVDYLVNDAGQGAYGRFAETALDQELSIIQLNVTTLVVLTKLFLRDMLARDSGRILQLASMVSKTPSPYQAVYAGTKAFVYNFTQSVIDELKGTNVTMTALRPGATDTDFFNKAGAEDMWAVQHDKLGPADAVARDGYEALMAGRPAIVSGLQNRIMDAVSNVIPDQAVARGMRKLDQPARKTRH
ncbi:SDR family NAD(P)-dependent oxidoreductase [Hydrocarboniphaga effusa]|jgi:short-subunit dehydrogenase|uniref:SDR family NAD(P)-dependent oxidoreductase n=1 Tax=Hydrocarboniphaga effusa TaxID=243629 RepID=UPI0035AF6038